jgi:glycosyltransferase involved in cell wall biosynthesis
MVVAISKWLYRNPAKCIGIVHTTISIWHPIIKNILIFLLKKLDHIVLISHAEKSIFVEKYGFLDSECTVIYNSIDEQEVQEKKKLPLPEQYAHIFQNEKYNFINIGRLTYQKNHALLLDAFEEVHKIYPETQLIIL